MRIISYSRMWPKLKQPIHTTFRFPRKDAPKGRDWHGGEEVQEYFKSRSPERQFIQIAKIIKKEAKLICQITEEEAIEDGFDGQASMYEFLGNPHAETIINKLTLKKGITNSLEYLIPF